MMCSPYALTRGSSAVDSCWNIVTTQSDERANEKQRQTIEQTMLLTDCRLNGLRVTDDCLDSRSYYSVIY